MIANEPGITQISLPQLLTSAAAAKPFLWGIRASSEGKFEAGFYHPF